MLKNPNEIRTKQTSTSFPFLFGVVGVCIISGGTHPYSIEMKTKAITNRPFDGISARLLQCVEYYHHVVCLVFESVE